MPKTTYPLPLKSYPAARQFPGAAPFPFKTILVLRGRLRPGVKALSNHQIQLSVKNENSPGSRAIFIEF